MTYLFSCSAFSVEEPLFHQKQRSVTLCVCIYMNWVLLSMWGSGYYDFEIITCCFKHHFPFLLLITYSICTPTIVIPLRTGLSVLHSSHSFSLIWILLSVCYYKFPNVSIWTLQVSNLLDIVKLWSFPNWFALRNNCSCYCSNFENSFPEFNVNSHCDNYYFS